MRPIDKFDYDNFEEGFKILEYANIIGDMFTNAMNTVDYHPDNPYDERGANGWGKVRASWLYPEVLGIFIDRYNDEKFSHSYEKYLNDELIQQFIEDLEIDKDKLWYAALFAYDFCNDLCDNGMVLIDSCENELTKLAEKIEELMNGWKPSGYTSPNSSLTLTLSNGNKKENLIIENPTSLYFIAESIKEKLQSFPMKRYVETFECRFSDKKKELTDSFKISHFGNMLYSLFDCLPQVEAKRKKGAKHSQKETDLICQLIYYTGLSLNKRWKDTENDYLKSFLRSYKVPDNVIGTIYPTK
jgi:hypothetical protein